MLHATCDTEHVTKDMRHMEGGEHSLKNSGRTDPAKPGLFNSM